MRIIQTKNLLLFVLTFFAVTACNNDEKERRLIFSEDTISGLPGSTRNITVTGGTGSYEVFSGNEKVATAAITEGSIIAISILELGETNITVKDESGLEGKIHVKGNTQEMKWEITQYEFTVETDNEELRQQIITDLKERILAPVGGKYVFTRNKVSSGEVAIYQSDSDKNPIQGTFEQGSYGWLIVSSDKQYLYRLIGARSRSTSRDEMTMSRLSLMEDLTEYYQELYPEEEIEKAELHFEAYIL